MAGHEGPVSCLAFNPMKALLYSSSWDRTVKIWDIFAQRSSKETLSIGSDGMVDHFVFYEFSNVFVAIYLDRPGAKIRCAIVVAVEVNQSAHVKVHYF